jgi:UDP-N-acetyl-D-mannosaminuronic acid dehydrogenase
MNKTITVLGLGYIGLPTALLFAQSGNKVIGVDTNQKVVNSLNKDILHIEESGLENLYAKVNSNFSVAATVGPSDVFIVAVPTPLKKSIHVSDLAYVRTAFETIYPYLKKDNLVILESTVTPGASEKLAIPILEKSGLKAGEFFYAHCPERAIPGKTLEEMVNNDRIIGGFDAISANLAKDLYSSFVKGNIFTTDIKTAEFAKLIENTYRDVNIALANELAQIAETAGINVWEAIALANKHPRVNILYPGPGVGGHCIAVDPWFLTEDSSTWGIIQLTRYINDAMPNHVLQLVRSLLEGIKDPVITVFGLAYKGNVGDTRETPALKFIKLAENEGYTIRCYDPHVRQFEHPILNLKVSVEGSDCIVIITDHDEFRSIDPAKLAMRRKNVVDTRNIIDGSQWQSMGFNVKILGIGTPKLPDFQGFNR